MNIEVHCTGCQSRYRVPVKMSGRMAQCRNCGQKFMVPYKSGAEAVVPDDGGGPRVRETDEPARKRRNVQHLRESGSAIAEDDGPRREDAFIKDLMNLKAIEQEEEDRKRKKFGGAQEQTFQGVPPLVTDLWVPLALIIAGYGLAIWTAVAHLLDSPGRTAGLILLGVVALLYLVLVMPLTMKMVEGAAKTLDFELANAAWLQTLAAFSIPTAGMTVGFFNGGWMGLIAGGIIGLAFMMPVLMFLYRVTILTAVQAVVLASLFYVLSLAGDLAVTLGIATFIFPMWNLRLPWGEPPPVQVATTQSTEAPKTSAVVETKPEVAPTTAPAVAALPDVAPVVVEEEPKWEVPVDPQVASVKWPGTTNHILYVKPPVHTVHATPPGPFVALIDSDSCDVYDLRTGKRSGGVKSGLPGAGAVLSGDGQFLAIVRPKTSIEIWSAQLGRPMATIAPDGFAMPQPLFFGTGGLVTTSQSGAKRSYEVWDPTSGQAVRSLEATGAGSPAVAISPGGRVLAQLTPGQLEVFDLKQGEKVGEQKVEAPYNRVRGMSFSPDGTRLAAVVADSESRLLVWDVNEGKLAHQHPIVTDVGSGYEEVKPVWAPDSAGVLLGNSLIDVTTGKVYFQVAAPVVPGSRPKATHVMSLYSVMFEFPPPIINGERVIYRSQRIAKNDLDVALKTIRGENWKPPGEDEATASGTEDAPTVAGKDDAPAAGAPAAPPINVAELVRKGEWEVTVQSVLKADPNAIAEQIRTEQGKLPPLEKAVDEADRKVDQVDVYETYTDGYGNRKRRRKFSESVVSEAKVTLLRAKKELTDARAVIARLNREMEEAAKSRTINAALADMPGGPQVVMIAEGEAVITTVDGLAPNTKCKVTGRARFADNTLTIWPRLIVPME